MRCIGAKRNSKDAFCCARKPKGRFCSRLMDIEDNALWVSQCHLFVPSEKNYHTIIPQISVRLSFDFHRYRLHDALRARPMCCSEPVDMPFLFEFLRIWSSYTIKRLCVVFASLHRQRCCDADGVARNIYPAINRTWVTV